MKLALISSPHEFETLEFIRSGYHLTLAQELFTDIKYQRYYFAKSYESNFIIVDNGAAEMGTALDFNEVLAAANSINADEVCLPDKLKDKEATLSMHYDNYDKVPSRNRMVIPQGTSVKEWFECLEEMMEVFDFFSVGIPKHLDDYPGGRIFALDGLEKHGYHKMFHVHLLGCHNSPLQEVQQVVKKFPWVRGIDTAAPFGYAQYGQRINYSKHLSYNFHKAVEDRALAIQNCLDLKEACNG